jgi:hypothetical protein
MYEPIPICLRTILEIANKRNEMTINEFNYIKGCIQKIARISTIVYTKTITNVALSNDQLLFIQHVLPIYIDNWIPKIFDVLQIYGLDVETFFYVKREYKKHG